jgi:hypothetical protein
MKKYDLKPTKNYSPYQKLQYLIKKIRNNRDEVRLSPGLNPDFKNSNLIKKI